MPVPETTGMDPKTKSYIITGIVVLVLGIIAYYVGSGEHFSVLRGANTHEEEAALTYYRNMMCMKCPDDPTRPLWARYSGRHCVGTLNRPLVVLHSDGDGRIEDMFGRAVSGLNVFHKIVGGRPPSWIHDTPSVWCFTEDSLFRYAGEMCVDGIRAFASHRYAAELVI